jgi:hypothetical protein
MNFFVYLHQNKVILQFFDQLAIWDLLSNGVTVLIPKLRVRCTFCCNFCGDADLSHIFLQNIQ